MTIYRIYNENGNRAGFWIQHRTWPNMCAQVQSIAHRESGILPGTPPARNQFAVLVNYFDVRSGRIVGLDPVIDLPDDSGYVTIAEPLWHRDPPRRHVRRTAQTA